HGVGRRVIPLVSGDLVTAERQQDVAAQPPPVDAGSHPAGRLDPLAQACGCWQRKVPHLDHVQPGVQSRERPRKRRLPGSRPTVNADQKSQPPSRQRMQTRQQVLKPLYAHRRPNSSATVSSRSGVRRAAKPATQTTPPGTAVAAAFTPCRYSPPATAGRCPARTLRIAPPPPRTKPPARPHTTRAPAP